VNQETYKDYMIISKSGNNYLVERVYREKAGGMWLEDGSFKQIYPVKDGLIDLGFSRTIGLIENGSKILFGSKEYTKSGDKAKQASNHSSPDAAAASSQFLGTWVYADQPTYKDYLMISKAGENVLVERVFKEGQCQSANCQCKPGLSQ
jgi:hypothetical protein